MHLLRTALKELTDVCSALRDLGVPVTILWAGADAIRVLTGAPMRRVSQITPQLHLGGQYWRRGWPRLAARGITAVVNMRIEFDDNDAGIAPPHYLYLPTADDEAPTLEQLGEGIAFIEAEIARGGAVYVHCNSGVGRAATLVAAYLVSADLTPEQAWARVRERRPFVYPTLHQIAQVERFARCREPSGKLWRALCRSACPRRALRR